MNKKRNYYKIIKIKDYLYTLQEDITAIHPIYKNSPLNLYLIVGTKSVLLIDTGCGIKSPIPYLKKLIGKRDLIVVNSHTHWDHILGNHFFKKVHVHKNGVPIISIPYEVSFLRDSPSDLIENYKKYNFTIPATQSIIGIEENHKFQLGNISLRILHTPGHSSDSICLLTNKGELFIGDVAYYGEQFLPERENFSNVLDTLSRLISLVEKRGNIEIYPSHDGLPCDKTLLTDLYDGIKNIDQIWEQKRINPFFSAYELEDDKFKYYVKKNYNNH